MEEKSARGNQPSFGPVEQMRVKKVGSKYKPFTIEVGFSEGGKTVPWVTISDMLNPNKH